MTQVSSLASQRIDQQDALDSATRSFALAETRYKTGLSDQILMLNAENTLFTAREQMAALIANSTIQRVTLLLSVGGGFNAPQTDSDDPSMTKTNTAKD
jgi:outer membrane protein TolC